MQIDVTWNLFFTPIFLFILYLVLRYYLGQRFGELHGKIEKNNDDAVNRFKENRSSLNKIGECMVSLKIEMEKRITRAECDVNHVKLWDRIHEIEKEGA
jgi:hypothetical protein